MTQPFCIVMQPLCPHCKRPRMICDADVRGCGTGGAGAAVGVPTMPKPGAPSLADWCGVCGFARAYCRGH
jgi:hypothetical protein